MTVGEFYRWIAYIGIEPFGDRRDDVRDAMAMKLQADMNRKKGRRPYDLDTFLPKFKQPQRAMPADEQEAATHLAFYQSYILQGGDPAAIETFRRKYVDLEE